jgi:DNA-binding NarL/FixJ family response regulator
VHRAVQGDGNVLVLVGIDADDDPPADWLRGGRDGHAGHGCPSGGRCQLIALLAPHVTRRLIAGFAARPSRRTKAATPAAQPTSRELEVIRLVARGRSNAEIAAEMVLSILTVKTHISRILTKLGLRDRTQPVVFA